MTINGPLGRSWIKGDFYRPRTSCCVKETVKEKDVRLQGYSGVGYGCEVSRWDNINVKPGHKCYLCKGQTKSKWFFQVNLSSKKQTNEFNFTTIISTLEISVGMILGNTYVILVYRHFDIGSIDIWNMIYGQMPIEYVLRYLYNKIT